ncbi:DUF2461 domain-containing protein [bacterium]|nr:DUF2461 domain-containing protein [bacterium]
MTAGKSTSASAGKGLGSAAATAGTTAAKTTAKSAAKTAAKSVAKSAAKSAAKTAAKSAGKNTAAPAAPFAGFSKATLAFYKGVEANNKLDWFNAHRDEYIRDVIAPAQALISELGPRLQKLSSGIGFHTDFNGKGSIKKIQTDRRFNPDRDPYKTWLDIMFWEGPAPVKKENPAFYIHLTTRDLALVCGAMYFEKNMLKAWRDAVLDPKLGPELDAVVRKLTGGKGGYKIYAETKKQLPRGVDPSHPQADYTKYESFCIVRETAHPKELFSSDFIAYCESTFKELLPLHKWLLKVYSKAY